VRRFSVLGWLLIVIGLVFVAIGIVYFGVRAPNLPSFLPGHVTGTAGGRYWKRGVVAFVLAIVAFAGAFFAGRRRS
jgi:hypothetical protein